ncbi:Uncharacterized protein APZ42_017235 [Daphnia magna]|uniref:Uncharacterized protein n=1 Tax=Daphnia magna TaxID=35525 RepID=A0A164ZQQ3_9CRUS|nr:Uncharacterized protein APZ42_017235 [Daphnia magna]
MHWMAFGCIMDISAILANHSKQMAGSKSEIVLSIKQNQTDVAAISSMHISPYLRNTPRKASLSLTAAMWILSLPAD